jgi:hypothetical protein
MNAPSAAPSRSGFIGEPYEAQRAQDVTVPRGSSWHGQLRCRLVLPVSVHRLEVVHVTVLCDAPAEQGRLPSAVRKRMPDHTGTSTISSTAFEKRVAP